MKILIADDSKMARKIVIKTLKESCGFDYEINEVVNGLEALNLYKQEKQNIIFLDLTMPIMDGFEALEKIKEYDKEANIVVVSADIQKASMDKVRTLGAMDFVKKPINSDKMKQIINKIKNK